MLLLVATHYSEFICQWIRNELLNINLNNSKEASLNSSPQRHREGKERISSECLIRIYC